MRHGLAALFLLFLPGCMMSFSEVTTSVRVKDPHLARVARIEEKPSACKLRREPDGALVETWSGKERDVVRADGAVLPDAEAHGDRLDLFGQDTQPPPWKDHTFVAPFCGCVRLCSPMAVVTPEANVAEIRKKSRPVYFGGAALVFGGLGLSAIGAAMMLRATPPPAGTHPSRTEVYAIDFPMFVVGAAMTAGGLSVLLSRPRETVVYEAPSQ